MRCSDPKQAALRAANRRLYETELETHARALHADTAPLALSILGLFVLPLIVGGVIILATLL